MIRTIHGQPPWRLVVSLLVCGGDREGRSLYGPIPGVAYVCKVLDTKAINAMSIPGGTVYVTKGLLDAVESDHELAGVLAHEIAHYSLYHVRRMIKKKKKSRVGIKSENF